MTPDPSVDDQRKLSRFPRARHITFFILAVIMLAGAFLLYGPLGGGAFLLLLLIGLVFVCVAFWF